MLRKAVVSLTLVLAVALGILAAISYSGDVRHPIKHEKWVAGGVVSQGQVSIIAVSRDLLNVMNHGLRWNQACAEAL